MVLIELLFVAVSPVAALIQLVVIFDLVSEEQE